MMKKIIGAFGAIILILGLAPQVRADCPEPDETLLEEVVEAHNGSLPSTKGGLKSALRRASGGEKWEDTYKYLTFRGCASIPLWPGDTASAGYEYAVAAASDPTMPATQKGVAGKWARYNNLSRLRHNAAWEKALRRGLGKAFAYYAPDEETFKQMTAEGIVAFFQKEATMLDVFRARTGKTSVSRYVYKPRQRPKRAEAPLVSNASKPQATRPAAAPFTSQPVPTVLPACEEDEVKATTTATTLPPCEEDE